jgi:hypothetical protein
LSYISCIALLRASLVGSVDATPSNTPFMPDGVNFEDAAFFHCWTSPGACGGATVGACVGATVGPTGLGVAMNTL